MFFIFALFEGDLVTGAMPNLARDIANLDPRVGVAIAVALLIFALIDGNQRKKD